VLANGLGASPSPAVLTAALYEACRSLAEQMVDDAEGATKVAHVHVRGAVSDEAAHIAARKVADSMLVQCSLFGEDPYWGRIISELGSAGTPFDIDRVLLAYGSTVADSTGGWTQAVAQLTAPSGAAWCNARVQVLSTGGAAEVHYVDDVLLGPATALPFLFDDPTWGQFDTGGGFGT